MSYDASTATTERGGMTKCVVIDDAGTALAGVAVSNGESVVATGADGTAELPEAHRSFVWVSRPDGFDTDRWFVRTDADPDQPVRFELRRVDQPLPLTFAQVTDLHVSALPEPATMPLEDSMVGFDEAGNLVMKPLTTGADLTRVLDQLAVAVGPHGVPRFFVATGALTDHGTDDDYSLLTATLASSPLPVHPLPGNHDHYGLGPEPDAEALRRYERHVGPRWWSLTHAGLRLVAIDWFSHRLGIDTERQERWLAADLATAAPGTPVLFLTHDQMSTAFYEQLSTVAPHVRVLGSLSGHWHTSRVVRHEGQLHANCGNATFGSFDWTPAHGRLVGWDGDELTLRSVAIDGEGWLDGATFRAGDTLDAPTASTRWSVRLPGAVHLARPLLADDAVVVAWSDEDAGAGGLSCHDLVTGDERWRRPLGAPVRAGATLLADIDTLVAVSIAGDVVGLDPATGEQRWHRQLGDRLRTWAMSAPVPVGDAVVVGHIEDLALLDGADGAVRWHRDDLEGSAPMATPMQGVVQDGVLVVAFSFNELHTVGLDPADGTVRWSGDGNRLNAPTSDVVADPDSGDVYLTRLGGRVERVAAATGEVRWHAKVRAAFATGRPLLLDDGVVVTSALGRVHRFDRADGTRRWRTQLPGDRLLAMGPYRRTGLAVPAGPTLAAAGTIVQVTGDGGVHRLDPVDGAVVASVDLGVPITVPAVTVGDDVVVATADGLLARLAL
ncbi:MAG: PQQ-binding-like beta-propeller repeat protein [Acidimicrobiia bacterium]|nr:PQQ-binding-like beta-propeller repeat protein [Acidimicrobiia bacterium]